MLSVSTAILLGTAPVIGAEHPSPTSMITPNSMKTSSPSDQPDFSLPRDVIAESRNKLQSLLDNRKDSLLSVKDSEAALRALLALSHAQSSVSQDSITEALGEYRRIASVLTPPYRALAVMAQADIISSFYSLHSYVYDSRHLDAANPPENMDLWDQSMFRSETEALITEALHADAGSLETQLSQYAGVLVAAGDKASRMAGNANLTLADFIFCRSLEMMESFMDDRPLPFRVAEGTAPSSFTESPSLFCNNLYREWGESIRRKPSPERLRLYLSRLDEVHPDRDYRATYLKDLYNRYEASEYAPVIAEYIAGLRSDRMAVPYAKLTTKQGVGNTDSFYDVQNICRILEKEIKAWPGSPAVPALKQILADLLLAGVGVDCPSSVMPGVSVPVTMTLGNLKAGHLLAFRLPEGAGSDSFTFASLKKLRTVADIPFAVSSELPFSDTLQLSLPPLPCGRYALMVSRSSNAADIIGRNEKDRLQNLPVINVSSLSYIIETSKSGATRLYIVNGSDGAPVEGAVVRVTTTGRDPQPVCESVTGENGWITLPSSPTSFRIMAEADGSSLDETVYTGYHRGADPAERLTGNIFLDRAIARPGDQIDVAVLLYRLDGRRISVAEDTGFSLYLRNASGVVTDSISLTTDADGRCHTSLRIPEEGMRGAWTLYAMTPDMKRFEAPSTSIRVEDYRNPTQKLTLDTPRILPDCGVTIKGKVETYSGMPAADAKVDLEINVMPLFGRFFYFDGGASPDAFTTTVRTAADGSFEITLDGSALKGTSLERQLFRVSATSVSQAGETCSDTDLFSFMRHFRISPDIPAKCEATGDSIAMTVRVNDESDLPVAEEVAYTLTRVSNGKTVKEGVFTAPTLDLPTAGLPSDTYRLTFRLKSDDKADCEQAEAEFTLWREDDRTVPGIGTLWLPQTSLTATAAVRSVEIPVGSRYFGQQILCTVSNCDSVLSRSWIQPDGGMTTVIVPAPEADSRTFVTFTTVRDFRAERQEVTILPAVEREKLDMTVVTFRDKLQSGTTESWSFRFAAGSTPVSVPAFAVMTDAALDALVPFSWHLSPRSLLSFPDAVSYSVYSAGTVSRYFSDPAVRTQIMPPMCPYSWIYAPMYSPHVLYDCAVAVRSTSRSVCDGAFLSASNAMTEEVAMPEAESPRNMSFKSAATGASENTSDGSDDYTYRASECPVAFFMPDLKSEPDGNLTIDFTVPDFNTEWKFQIAAYDERLSATTRTLTAVSAKAVMVTSTLPRFVRTGDRVVIAATAFNNADRPLDIGGRIEILDPESGRIIARKEFKGEALDPAASRLLTLELDVPDLADALLVRVYADGDGNSDGEQQLLTVLPASTPVLDSYDFYLKPDEREFSIEIPKLHKESAVTLVYCDNPAWSVLTALPSLTESHGKSLTSLLYAYYGNSIGFGLLRSRPELGEALMKMTQSSAEDNSSALTSPLELNADMKNVRLAETPWVNSAASETARMKSLSCLLDSTSADATLSNLLADIRALQNNDGGMKWYPEATSSSTWCTGQMLLHFAMLDRFGYLPHTSEMKAMVRDAFAYYDKTLTEEWEELRNHYQNDREATQAMLSELTGRLYTGSQFKPKAFATAPKGKFKTIAAQALELIRSEWKEMDIYDKATAATLLAKKGHTDEARAILNSLSQFATVTERGGMWFDNLESGIFSPWNKLITTAQVLEAYCDIEPDAPQVDQLRQWLLLQRQTENWGALHDAAELVQAILTSGTDYTTSDTPQGFTISADGRTLLASSGASYSGESVISLDPQAVSGKKVTVSRQGSSPAWGAVTEQYIAPLAAVKSFSVDDLSISKSILLHRDDNGQTEAVTVKDSDTLHVGDEVTVLLTVECGRDMQYVAITDQRGACLEPTDQLSGVTFADRIPLYKEIRNSATDLLIEYLPKGRYQFSYSCRVTQEGTFSIGIADIQSQYAPQLAAHSGAYTVTVKR